MKPGSPYIIFRPHWLSASAVQRILYALLIGVIYSLLFWPLLNSICIICLFTVWLVSAEKRLPDSREQQRYLLLFPCLYLISVIGLSYTQNLDEGLFRLQQKLPLLVFPLILGTSNLLSNRNLKQIYQHFILATAIACLISLASKLIGYMWPPGISWLDSGSLFVFKHGYPYVIGLICITAILLSLQLIRDCSKRTKILLVLAILLFSTFILLLSVRVVIGCWALLMILSLDLLRSRLVKLTVSAILLLSITLAVISIPTLNRQFKELADFRKNMIELDKDSSLGRSWGGGAIRIAIWQSSTSLVKNHWLVGVGTGDIQDNLQQAYKDRKFYFASDYNKYNAHNQYLQMLIGHGIIGVSILLTVIFMPIVYKRSTQRNFTYLAFLTVFALICFTEVILDVSKGLVWYSLMNSIFAFSATAKTIN